MSDDLYPVAQKGVGVRIAHDPGDPLITSHCPFCGSGQVVGRSDGTISCDFCGQVYIVRVQPAFPGMPQAPMGPGAPSDIGPDGGVLPPDAMGPDGLPMGGAEVGPDGEPLGDEGFPPDEMDDGEEGPPEDLSGPPGAADDGDANADDGPPPPKKDKGKSKKGAAKVRRCKHPSGKGGACGELIVQGDDRRWHHQEEDLDRDHDAQPWWDPPKEAARTYHGLNGEVLTEDQLVRHLAATLSGGHPAVMAQLRRDARGLGTGESNPDQWPSQDEVLSHVFQRHPEIHGAYTPDAAAAAHRLIHEHVPEYLDHAHHGQAVMAQ